MKPGRPRWKSHATRDPSRNDAQARTKGDDRASLTGDGHAAPEEAAEDLTENPFALFTEWDSEADHKAYDQL